MITQSIDLNLIPGAVMPRINVSQYDKGSRTLVFNLYAGAVAFSVPVGATVQIVGTKKDHTGFEYSCTASGSTVTADLTDQMTVFPGEVVCELRIYDDGDVLGTANFVLNVETSALADDVPISETDIPIIQELPEILAEVEAARDLAELWAVGPNGSGSDEPSATNNAYYWALQAASAAGGGLQPEVVSVLPTQNISTSKIYFVPSADPSASNFYDEYINLDGTSQGWELIGTTAIDLTNYYTKTETDAEIEDAVDGTIATVESSATASKAYAVGEFLVYEGKLRKVTSAITQGGTITPGTNVSDTTAGAEFATINSNLTDLMPNNLATSVSLASYTSRATSYKCPSDGYLYIDSNTSGTINILVGMSFADSTGFIQEHITTVNISRVVFVKKGMILWAPYQAGVSMLEFRALNTV